MTPRYLPYATTPARLLAQLISDVVVIAWTSVWVLVGIAVHAAVSTIADVGRQLETGANGVADNLSSAGDSTDDVPLVGDATAWPHSSSAPQESAAAAPKTPAICLHSGALTAPDCTQIAER